MSPQTDNQSALFGAGKEYSGLMFHSSLIARAARPRGADTEVQLSVCDPRTNRGAPTLRPSGGPHHAAPATGRGGELTAHWQFSPAGGSLASWSLVVVGDAAGQKATAQHQNACHST